MDVLEAPRGLNNVVVTQTSIGDVRGEEGFYHYRQYSAIDLAKSCSFEDVWFLFVEGRLPDADERERFLAEIAPLRELPEEVLPALRAVALAGTKPNMLGGLRTILSLVGSARGMAPVYGSPPEQRRADALLVSAVTPTILAALHRIRAGLDPLQPRSELSMAQNWLYLISGEVPTPTHARAIEQYLIATIDHGFNASTFTARVVASTGADVAAAVCAAIGAFSGPLHGGAPDRALDALDAIGTPDQAEQWVRDRVAAGERIMGFGHAVYRTDDPRSLMLRSIAQSIGGPLVDFATSAEQIVVDTLAELKPDRVLYANVEFYAGVVMELCGIPRSMFTPTFACSRVVGWSANILEQAQDSKMIRPIARYVGPAPSQPIEVR
ncbi:citrate/2-methylcitrate synthase [Antrihabitans cavernicola]|uniref:Citrate synthase n=1 Tax=Antrihabitans cavernicola TaxID=2495913 RepID=A0A5A7S5H9_9NOCA|nr:citrate/2-methylcitrate synthase [Spelaeibacter cavernicola]KAA0021430.1 citrate synthase/methylcitrate synthase [Spelaeibacter cavernicola]